jgi:hypothetical protein
MARFYWWPDRLPPGFWDDAIEPSSSGDSLDEETPPPSLLPQKHRCPVCCLAYGRRGDLKLHVQIKHREFPDLPEAICLPRRTRVGKANLCPVDHCPSGFLRRSDLSRHFKKKHGMHIDAYEAEEKERGYTWDDFLTLGDTPATDNVTV